MASKSESLIKISKTLIKYAYIQAESNNYFGAILTLRSIQKDLDKFLSSTQGDIPTIQ